MPASTATLALAARASLLSQGWETTETRAAVLRWERQRTEEHAAFSVTPDGTYGLEAAIALAADLPGVEVPTPFYLPAPVGSTMHGGGGGGGGGHGGGGHGAHGGRGSLRFTSSTAGGGWGDSSLPPEDRIRFGTESPLPPSRNWGMMAVAGALVGTAVLAFTQGRHS